MRHPGTAGSTLKSCHLRGHLAAVGSLLCLLLWLGAPAGGEAQTPNAAGIVVDYGDGRMTYAYVPFVEEEISGIELLRRSGVPLVTVSFGGLGEGVCMVDETGCGVTECRRRMCQTGERSSPFWQYARQESPGEWRTFSLGASQSRVRDGDIDGWVWSGDPPKLPPITLEELRRKAGGEVAADDEGGDRAERVAVRTVGGESAAGADETAAWRLAAGVGVLVAVSGAGGVVVWRARRVQRSPER